MHRGGRGDARASCASPLGTPLASSPKRSESKWYAYVPTLDSNWLKHKVRGSLFLVLKISTKIQFFTDMQWVVIICLAVAQIP
jgi:hypothetical protein